MCVYVYAQACVHIYVFRCVFIWPHDYILNTGFFDEDMDRLGSC